MAFDNSYVAVTGATYSASDYNTYTRANFTAIWVGTTAGDMDYYTSATAKARLAIGTAYQVMYSTGSAPAWGSLATILANAAVVASQAAGDIIKAVSATALGRVAAGALHTFLKSDGSGPAYGALSYRRQGGSATVWATNGTTTYTPSKELIQKGVIAITVSGGTGTASVTFPTAYSYAPHLQLTVQVGSSNRLSTPNIYALSTTGFTVELFHLDGGGGTFYVHWATSGE